ncbi:hypothetical protein QQP08_021316 [Theobroma cacao]|nr:hypothetical protein QQP08_021316 [Theobroma cacao]
MFETRCRFNVSIPTLKRLTSSGFDHIGFKIDFHSYNTVVTDLFKGICNVKSLRIYAFLREVFPQGSVVIPELPKVTYMNLDGHFLVGWERLLPDLLACFPCLEALDFNV